MAPDWQQGRQAGRPGASRGRSVVWPRQSAAHNWPVTSTQQNFIHARAGQESTRPLRNIQIFTRFSLLVTKTDKKAYSRLFTNSIWDIMKAEVGWLGGWGLWGQSSHSSPEGPKAGPPPQAPGSARHWILCYWERGLILLVEELHFVACGPERARVRIFPYNL